MIRHIMSSLLKSPEKKDLDWSLEDWKMVFQVNRELLIRTEVENGTLFFDREHSHKVWKEKGCQRNQTKVEDHPLVGTHMTQRPDGKRYLVEMVYREWHYGGWYWKVIYQHAGSHGIRPFKNEGTLCPVTIKYCGYFLKTFEIEIPERDL